MISQELSRRLESYKYYRNYVYHIYDHPDRCRYALNRVNDSQLRDSFRIHSYKKVCTQHLEKQKLHARVTRALSFLYGESLKCRCLATIICRLLPKLAVSHDNPNSNVSYSRNGESYKNHKRRVSIKFCRLLSRYYPGKFTDKELEKLQMAYEYECPYVRKVLEGEEALAIYRNCASEDFKSCMTGSNSSLLEDHFLCNTEKLKLVVLYIGNKVVARAKLWTNDDGTLFLDRVYVRRCIPNLTEDSATTVISQGYSLVDYYDITIYSPPGSMPYLDYPDKFDRIGDKIRLHKDGDFEASSADGLDESTCCTCDACDESCSETEELDGQDLCESCAESFRVNHTEINGTWYNDDDVVYDEIDDCSIRSCDAIILHDGRYTHEDNAVELDRSYYTRNSWAYEDDVIETHDGRTILESDYVEHLGKIYHEDEELPEEVTEDEVDEALQTVE